jgi:hypothetical protein
MKASRRILGVCGYLRHHPKGEDMADDKKKVGAPDRARVAKMEDYEVDYLARKHEVTKKLVRETVDKVGNSRTKVERELKLVKKGG